METKKTKVKKVAPKKFNPGGFETAKRAVFGMGKKK